MCYDIMQCPRCGAWLDEFNWDDHLCETPVLEKLPEVDTQKEADTKEKKVIEISVNA